VGHRSFWREAWHDPWEIREANAVFPLLDSIIRLIPALGACDTRRIQEKKAANWECVPKR
jgi:hypothetical protein